MTRVHNHVSNYFKLRGLCVQKSLLTWLSGRKQYRLMLFGEKKLKQEEMKKGANMKEMRKRKVQGKTDK
jgi:hypothetical protein